MKKILKKIFKKNKNLSHEELVLEINKLYKDFKFSQTLAHHKTYFLIKKDIDKYLKILLIDYKNNNNNIEKLKKIHSVLTFINENPFSIDQNNDKEMRKLINILKDYEIKKKTCDILSAKN